MSRPPADDPVVVVGSGPCGAMAAAELTAAGVPVLMLDAGREPPPGLVVHAAGRTVLRWRSDRALSTNRHEPVGDPAPEWFSSQSPGGLSNYWTAAVPRFAPEDFIDGAAVDERFRWPVTYDDLVPHYEAAEAVLAVSGPTEGLPVLPAGRTRYASRLPSDWQALAEGPMAGQLTTMPLARGARWMIARRGSEFNSYHVVVRPLERERTFELRRGARVRRLHIEGDSVVGVEYLDAATRRAVVLRARSVVLAAGAVDTATILLASTSSDHPTGIGDSHGLLGRYLHDHPRDWWPVELSRPLTLLDHPAYIGRPAYAGAEPLRSHSLTIGLASARDRPRSMLGRVGARLGVQVFGTMVPSFEGRVSLPPDQRGADGEPRPQLDVRYDGKALATLSDAQERCAALFADAGIRATVHPVDGYVAHPGSSVHYAGCVRMHADAQHGVLDEWNRVRDAPNVVVADLACFTTNPEKNPTLTAMALAGRAARHLAANG